MCVCVGGGGSRELVCACVCVERRERLETRRTRQIEMAYLAVGGTTDMWWWEYDVYVYVCR
jgi:hypothetical protein